MPGAAAEPQAYGKPAQGSRANDGRRSARTVTYVCNATVPLTKACVMRCSYCGYYEDDAPLLTPAQVHRLLDAAEASGATEILILSGDLPETFPRIRRQLRELGCVSFVDYVLQVCAWCLERNLLPHTNIGYVTYGELQRLREVNGSMGIMLETTDPELAKRVQPKKSIAARLEVIRNAGRLRIPFTSGILMGMGEEQPSRLASLEAIIRLHEEYHHIQEVILQNFVPNSRSALRLASPLTFEEYAELIAFVRQRADIEVQIPPNLVRHYPQLVECGATDLGGVSADIDYVNFENPWDEPAMQSRLRAAGCTIRLRLAVYAKYVWLGWCAPRVANVVERYSREDAYRYYTQSGRAGSDTHRG